MAQEIASGSVTEIPNLGDYDFLLKEGDSYYLELQLLFVPPGMDALLSALDWGLKKAGVTLTKPSEVLEGRKVRIHFKRAVPPLVIIAAALVGLWLVMIVSWRLMKPEAREVGAFILLLVGAILVAAVIIAIKGKVTVPGLAVG